MNDADLEKLTIRPGKLEPPFSRDVTSYFVVLPSDTKHLLIDPVTRDREASWTIIGIGNKRQLLVRPGSKRTYVIEVTAEDGSTKEYKIAVSCLSANDASLLELNVSLGELVPGFSNDNFSYVVEVPWYASSVDIDARPMDKNTGVTITNALDKTVALNYGEVTSEIRVLSPDKKNTKTFLLKFTKFRMVYCIEPIPTDDHEISARYKCPVCLNVTHCPRVIRDTTPEYLFCKLCLETITRRYPFHPILHSPLFENFMTPLETGESDLAKLRVRCPFHFSGCREEPPLPILGQHISRCAKKPIFVTDDKGKDDMAKGETTICRLCSRKLFDDEKDAHMKFMCVAKFGSGKFTHRAEIRSWEHSLQQKYIDSRVEPVEGPTHTEASTPKEAIQNLFVVAWKFATAIKLDQKNAKLHYKLGMVFEEIHLAMDMYGTDTVQDKEEDDYVFDQDRDQGLIELGGDAANEEEVKAICQSRNVTGNASLAQQLKALDEEYHYLLDVQLSAKADYVRKLYSWKSKQASSKDAKGDRSVSEDSYLYKAFLKYLDASAHDPNKYLYHLHVGRHLLMQKNYFEASKRLQVAVGLRPTSIAARFYLALAVTLGKEGRSEECIRYFREGIDYLLFKIHKNADSSQDDEMSVSMACQFTGIANTLLLEGILQYAKIINIQVVEDEENFVKNKKKMVQILQLVCVVGMHFLENIYHVGDIARQIQFLILKAHYSIGSCLSAEVFVKAGNSKRGQELKRFWVRLASLMKAFGLPTSKDTLELEKRICEEAVFLQPCSSQALCRLADNRLAVYDADTKQKKYLKEADAIYRLSISTEGQPIDCPEVATVIQEATWYKDKIQRLLDKGFLSPTQEDPAAEKKNLASPKVQSKAPATSTPTKLAKPAAKVPVAGRRGTVTKTTLPSKPAASSKPACPKKGDSSKSTKGNNTDATPEAEQGTSEATEETTTSAVLPFTGDSAELNRPSYQTRLGLARALTRYRDKTYDQEINALYREVILMAPYVHDAYIELGEILRKLDPAKAIDLYASYPFSQQTSTDDAYLHGEIVRLLMKDNNYNDPRLGTSLVMYGKAFGFSSIEKYVELLETKGQIALLRRTYAAIHGKAVEDPGLTEFFRFKCWI